MPTRHLHCRVPRNNVEDDQVEHDDRKEDDPGQPIALRLGRRQAHLADLLERSHSPYGDIDEYRREMKGITKPASGGAVGRDDLVSLALMKLRPGDAPAMEDIMFTETATLGVRRWTASRRLRSTATTRSRPRRRRGGCCSPVWLRGSTGW